MKAKREEIAKLTKGAKSMKRQVSRKKLNQIKKEGEVKVKTEVENVREEKDREIKRLKSEIEVLKKPARPAADAKLEGKSPETQIALLKAERSNAEMVLLFLV